MATLAETIFIIQLIGLMIILGMKLYNIMNVGKAFDNTTVWLTFIAGIFLYGLGMVASILSYEQNIFLQIFRYERLLLLLGAVLHFIEVIINLSATAQNTVTGQRRNSADFYKNG